MPAIWQKECFSVHIHEYRNITLGVWNRGGYLEKSRWLNNYDVFFSLLFTIWLSYFFFTNLAFNVF